MPPRTLSHRPPARRIALVGTFVVTAYAALAALQILVLNPLAAVPGTSLPQIEAQMARWGEGFGTPWVLALLAVGVAIAAGLLVLAWRLNHPEPRTFALAYLALLALGAPAYFVASFGPGMALADSFGISGGDHSPWALPLYTVSALALVALVILAVVPRRAPALRRGEPA